MANLTQAQALARITLDFTARLDQLTTELFAMDETAANRWVIVAGALALHKFEAANGDETIKLRALNLQAMHFASRAFALGHAKRWNDYVEKKHLDMTTLQVEVMTRRQAYQNQIKAIVGHIKMFAEKVQPQEEAA